VPGLLALLSASSSARRCGALNGFLVTRLKLPPFIVTLGTLNIFFALNRWSARARRSAARTCPSLLTWTGKTINLGGFRITYGSILMLLLFAVFFYALKNTAWGKHVYADRRRRRGRPPGRHPHRPRAAERLRRRRADLRGRRLDADRPHRLGQPERRHRVQPRLDHRGRDRRHQPVRRPRPRDRHADRRADRRRVPQRPARSPASTSSGRASPSACWSSSRSPSTSGSGR
jgi:hypothetical protein